MSIIFESLYKILGGCSSCKGRYQDTLRALLLPLSKVPTPKCSHRALDLLATHSGVNVGCTLTGQQDGSISSLAWWLLRYTRFEMDRFIFSSSCSAISLEEDNCSSLIWRVRQIESVFNQVRQGEYRRFSDCATLILNVLFLFAVCFLLRNPFLSFLSNTATATC